VPSRDSILIDGIILAAFGAFLLDAISHFVPIPLSLDIGGCVVLACVLIYRQAHDAVVSRIEQRWPERWMRKAERQETQRTKNSQPSIIISRFHQGVPGINFEDISGLPTVAASVTFRLLYPDAKSEDEYMDIWWEGVKRGGKGVPIDRLTWGAARHRFGDIEDISADGWCRRPLAEIPTESRLILQVKLKDFHRPSEVSIARFRLYRERDGQLNYRSWFPRCQIPTAMRVT
jgi:hypothetical protein